MRVLDDGYEAIANPSSRSRTSNIVGRSSVARRWLRWAASPQAVHIHKLRAERPRPRLGLVHPQRALPHPAPLALASVVVPAG